MTAPTDAASLAAAEAEELDAVHRLALVRRRIQLDPVGPNRRADQRDLRDVQADLREAAVRVQNIKAARFAAGLDSPPALSRRTRRTNRTPR